MKIWLNVPYGDKEKAKAAGARWSPAYRRWYVDAPNSVSQFARWMPNESFDPHKLTKYEQEFLDRKRADEKRKK